MRRISPIGKRRAQGQQAAASGAFLWAVQDGPDQEKNINYSVKQRHKLYAEYES